MPKLFVRIFLLYNLLNAVLLYLIPKKLRTFLPPSWFNQTTITTTNTTVDDQKKPLLSPSENLVKMKVSELKRVFQMFDRNGDGRITKAELNQSLENLGIYISEKEMTQMIEKIDVNGDGYVDIEEFDSLYNSIMDEKEEGEDEMKEAFDVFDINGDGFISVDELKSVMVSLGFKKGRTAEDCKKMINQVDVDGDGRVNYKEFRHMMEGEGAIRSSS